MAGIILSLDTKIVNELSEYCQLQAVPDDFPYAKKANLFCIAIPNDMTAGGDFSQADIVVNNLYDIRKYL